MHHPSLRGAVVVITGASSGNGRATALAFAREGARLILAARREAALREAASECEEAGGKALAVVTDVSDPVAVEELGRKAVAAFGRIDIWINNAGVLHVGRLDETPTRVLRRVIETNLLGCIHGSQVALRHFRRRGRGTLINTSSVLGVVGQPFAGAYVASKFGIRGLSEVLRQETANEPHIHVCTILPAAIDTPTYQRAANYSGKAIRPVVPTYDVKVVAEANLSLARHPRREAYAGGIGPLVAVGKCLAPAVTERAANFLIRRMEFGGNGVPLSDGNLFEPSFDGWRIRGGWIKSRGWDRKALIGLVTVGASLGLLLSMRR